jgi:hypothetical protein
VEAGELARRSTHVFRVDKLDKKVKTSSQRVLRLNTQGISLSKKEKAGDSAGRKERRLEDLRQVVKSYRYPRKLKLFWRGQAPWTLQFPSAEKRERFHEILFLFGLHPDCELRTPRPGQTPVKLVTRADNLTIFIGTWNMGNAPPQGQLGAWIPRGLHDIYAIGNHARMA